MNIGGICRKRWWQYEEQSENEIPDVGPRECKRKEAVYQATRGDISLNTRTKTKGKSHETVTARQDEKDRALMASTSSVSGLSTVNLFAFAGVFAGGLRAVIGGNRRKVLVGGTVWAV